jgi:hypothetical protein
MGDDISTIINKISNPTRISKGTVVSKCTAATMWYKVTVVTM